MIERDYEHQLHWLAAVKELEKAEERGVIVPVEFPYFEGEGEGEESTRTSSGAPPTRPQRAKGNGRRARRRTARATRSSI